MIKSDELSSNLLKISMKYRASFKFLVEFSAYKSEIRSLLTSTYKLNLSNSNCDNPSLYITESIFEYPIKLFAFFNY